MSTPMPLNLNALEASLDLVAARDDELMDDFFSRLFAAAPGARSFLPDDLGPQKTVLLATLALVRRSLHNLDAIAPTLRRLGACNVAHGAKPEHYSLVGSVLVAALASVAGDAWTPEHELAWNDAYELVTGRMLEGAEQAVPAAAA